MLCASIFQRSCSKPNPLISKTYPSVCFNFQLVSASCITYQSIFMLRLQIRFALPLYLWTFPAEFKPHFPSSRTDWPFSLIKDKCHWLSTFGGWEFSRSSLRFLYLLLENKYQTILISLPIYGDECESFSTLRVMRSSGVGSQVQSSSRVWEVSVLFFTFLVTGHHILKF